MEIILDKVKYSSKKIDENINNVTYTFKNSITFVDGISGQLIRDLLYQEKLPKKGIVALNKKGKKYDISYLSKDYVFYKNNIYEEIVYLNKIYRLNYKNIEKRIKDALKMVNLDITYISEDFDSLSSNEKKLLSLAIALIINSKIIILDYFEKGLSYNQINYMKKLLLKINKMYNKSIIIISNDLDNYINIVRDIVIFNMGDIVFKGTKDDLYNNELYKYIDTPHIINFIKYLEKKDHKFDHYIDIKELLKAIYRDVENK